MKNLTTAQQTLKNATWKKTVLLVKFEWNDAVPTTEYYSERLITYNSQAYTRFVIDIANVRQTINQEGMTRIDDCRLILDNTKTIGVTTRWTDKFTSIGAPEKAIVTIYIYFDDASPQAVEVGRFYVNGVEYDNERATLDLVEISKKLLKPIGLRAARATFANIHDNHEGSIAPIVYGSPKRVPMLCVQAGANSKLNGAITSSATTITVHPVLEDGLQIPSSGTGEIDQEQVTWTSTTPVSGGTQLNSVTRGAGGTSAAAHQDGASFAVVPSGGWKYIAAGHRIKAFGNVYFYDGKIVNTADYTANANDTTIWSGQTVASLVFTRVPRAVQTQTNVTSSTNVKPDIDLSGSQNPTDNNIKLNIPALEQIFTVSPNAFSSGNAKGLGDILPNGSGTGSGNAWQKYYSFTIESDSNVYDSNLYAGNDIEVQGAISAGTTGNMSINLRMMGSDGGGSVNNASVSFSVTKRYGNGDSFFANFDDNGTGPADKKSITEVNKGSVTTDADVSISDYSYQIKYFKRDTTNSPTTTNETINNSTVVVSVNQTMTVYDLNNGIMYADIDGMTVSNLGVTLITNPVDIKRNLITNTQGGLLGLTDATYIDGTSFDTNSTLLTSDGYAYHFALFGAQKDPLQVISELDFWSRSRTYMVQGKFFSKYIPQTTVFIDKNLTTDDVRANEVGEDWKSTMRVARTPYDLIQNKINIHYKPRYVTFTYDNPRRVNDYVESKTYSATNGTLGTDTKETTIYCPYIISSTVADLIGNFLLTWRKNVRRVLQWESGVQNVELEVTDSITHTYSDYSLTASNVFFIQQADFIFGKATRHEASPETIRFYAEEIIGATTEDAYRMLHWYIEGRAIDEEAIEGPVLGVTAQIIGMNISARTAPTGANLQVDIIKDGVEQATLSTLTAGSTGEKTTFSTPLLFASTARVGVKVKQVGSTEAGRDLNIHVFYKVVG